MNFSSKWKLLLDRAGKKELRQRAEYVGVSYEYARQIEHGERVPTDERIVDICQKIGADETETRDLLFLAAIFRSKQESTRSTWEKIFQNITDLLAKQSGEQPTAQIPTTSHEIPVFSAIVAGSGSMGLSGEKTGTIEVTENEMKSHVFAIRVTGDSMSPEIQDGDIALFRPVNGNQPKDGTICAVSVSGWKQWAVKAVEVDPRGRVLLRSINPAFQTIEVNPEETSVSVMGIIYKIVRTFNGFKEEAGPYRVRAD
jgi:SOS-response transcriptional repressor LexA